jgi:hypothetical protein
MRDQLTRLPPGVPGAMLWGGQTRAEAEAVMQEAAAGALKVQEGGAQWGGHLHRPVIASNTQPMWCLPLL